MGDLSFNAKHLLRVLKSGRDTGSFATACDGKENKAAAHELETAGLAEWKGTNWGSSFWAITDAGYKYPLTAK